MSVSLTPQQQQVLDAAGAEPPRFSDPRTNADYVLIPAAEYDSIREMLLDEAGQRSIRAVGLRNAAGRIDEAP